LNLYPQFSIFNKKILMLFNKIIFFHIPKCGGTSVEESFEKVYGRGSVKFPATVIDYLAMPPDITNEFKVLAGHISHDLALPYIDKNTLLITLFRNPLKRIRSLYNYYRVLNDSSNEFNLALSMSFREWLNSKEPTVLIHIQNAVIRQFTPESYWDINKSACPELILSYAKKFIQKFHIIGSLEKYDDYVHSINNLIGMSLSSDVVSNKSKIESTSSVDDEELMNWLLTNSKLDVDFYDFVINIKR